MAHAVHPAPATRPALEVAHILRESADAYRETHRLSAQQLRVVHALVSCRTAALGGFKSHCNHCGAVTIQYASCRNRHCPKCQTLAQTRWVERQCADLLDIAYWHVVFTVPHELNGVAQRHPALIYRLLFKAASETLLEFGRNPRWLGGELGITMVLHTWGQNLGQHIHVHCIVTDGALSPDRKQWLTPPRRGFLFPTTALSKVFRGKYVDFLSSAHRNGELRMPDAHGVDDNRAFEYLKASLQSHAWGDSDLYLRRRDSQIVMTVEHRAAPGLNDIEVELADDGQGPALRLRRQVPDEAAPEPETPEQRIVQVIAEADKPLSQRQIRERAATRPATVGAALEKLIREHRVECAPAGGYRLAGPGTRHRDLLPNSVTVSNP